MVITLPLVQLFIPDSQILLEKGLHLLQLINVCFFEPGDSIGSLGVHLLQMLLRSAIAPAISVELGVNAGGDLSNLFDFIFVSDAVEPFDELVGDCG